MSAPGIATGLLTMPSVGRRAAIVSNSAASMSYLDHNFTPGVLSGSYGFTGTFTSLPGAASTGSGLADLLLGVPATTSISSNNYEFRYKTNYASLYIQDNYKLTSKLTVNFGLRWEFDGPTTGIERPELYLQSGSGRSYHRSEGRDSVRWDRRRTQPLRSGRLQGFPAARRLLL